MDPITQHLAGHHGVISRDEARSLGMSDSAISRRLASGRWQAIHRGVYRLAGAPPTWLGSCRGAVLASDGLASHRGAARLWGIEGFERSWVEITVPIGRLRLESDRVTVHRSTQLDLAAPTERLGIPTTGLARTVLDLAAVLSRRYLDQAVDSVLRQRMLQWHDLVGVLVRHSRRGRDGCGRLRLLLDERYGEERPPGSVFNRLVAELLADEIWRPIVHEYELFDEGRFVARVDLAYPNERLAIELDSRAFHDNAVSFVEDRRRANRITNLGWRLLSFTWDDYRDSPDLLVESVRDGLRGRSGGSVSI